MQSSGRRIILRGRIKLSKWLLSAGLAALSWSVGLEAQTAHTLAEDAKAFGAREAVRSADLSADGTQILYLTPGAGRQTVAMISNIITGKSESVIASGGNPESLSWCRFVAAQRAVCRYWGTVDRAGILIGAGRLLASDVNSGNIKLLGQRESAYDEYLRQFDGSVIDWLDSNSGSVLMARVYVPEAGRTGSHIAKTKKGLGVDQIDTVTLRTKTVEPANDEASGYYTDGRGNVRMKSAVQTGPDGLTGKIKYWYRRPGSREWETLVNYHEFEDFTPLAIDADVNALYALKKKGGRYALYTIKLDGTLAERLVAEHPRVDIDDVVRFGDGQRVIGYRYAEEESKTVYFDPEFKALGASLSKALPNLPIISFVDSSSDGRKLLIFAGSDRDPGRYYLFDRDKKALNELMLERPELEGRTLAEVKPVTVTAADGTPIPAYLTLPPGKEPKGLPAIVLPHGGPSARDYWGFDWLAQFLAARGYAVLQPNYRGSAGYGDAWLKDNGFKSWRTSIGDITASARWLASQGIADPNKLAILGWSYGGYAALQSAATEPSLFKAVVAVAPVTDLSLLKEESRNYANRRIVEDFVGSGPHVAEGSPLRKAAAITAPVLLVHGDLDTNVRISHAEKMDSALRSAGKQSEFLKFKGLDHQLVDPAARTEMLMKIGSLLERTIGR
jgi:dipeptidyl aminopeptidase/acylaminoacyl peptidase